MTYNLKVVILSKGNRIKEYLRKGVEAQRAEYKLRKHQTHCVIKAAKSIHIRFNCFTAMPLAIRILITSVTLELTTLGTRAKQFWSSEVNSKRRCGSCDGGFGMSS